MWLCVWRRKTPSLLSPCSPNCTAWKVPGESSATWFTGHTTGAMSLPEHLGWTQRHSSEAKMQLYESLANALWS